MSPSVGHVQLFIAREQASNLRSLLSVSGGAGVRKGQVSLGANPTPLFRRPCGLTPRPLIRPLLGRICGSPPFRLAIHTLLPLTRINGGSTTWVCCGSVSAERGA
jgi:hypothetical protein